MIKAPVVLVVVVLAVACMTGRTNDSQVASTPSVPAQAPDTTPAWFQDDTSFTTFSPTYVKHVIGVVFRDGTTQADRQSAVDRVGGNVVGGWQFTPNTEGMYAVQVKDGGDPRKHQQLIDLLRTLPQVKSATQVETVGTSAGLPTNADST